MKLENDYSFGKEGGVAIEDEDMKFFGKDGITVISYKQTPKTYQKAKQLRNVFASSQGKIPDEESISLVQRAVLIEQQEKENPELVESVLGIVDIKIKEKEYEIKEKQEEPFYELTTDVLQRMGSFSRGMVRDFLKKGLLSQTKFLEKILREGFKNPELLINLMRSEDLKARLIFNSMGKLLKHQKEKVLQVEDINFGVQKEFESQQNTYIEFLGTLGHDYIGLLGSILASISLFDMGEIEEDQIKIITKSFPRELRNMMEERILLLDPPDYKQHHSSHIFKKVVEPLKGLLLKKRIKLELGKKDVEIFSDEARVQVWLYNFLTNAIKFTEEGGTISLFGEYIEDEENVRLSVKDEGIGLFPRKIEYFQKSFNNEVKLERVFSESGTAGETGSGKGLRNCIDLVKEIEGARLEVTSKRGEGSTFSCVVFATEEKYNKFLQQEHIKRIAIVNEEIPRLIQGILLNAEKREAGQDEEMKRRVDKVLSGIKFAQKEVI